MKKILGLLLYAGLIFGVTAGIGMFMLKQTASHGDSAEHGEEEEGHTGEEPDGHESPSGHVVVGDHSGTGHAGSSHGNDTHASASDHGAHGSAGSSHADERLPVAVRASPMSVEEIVRMGLSLKSRDEIVSKREASLRDMESQQQLVVSDMTAIQQEIENLLARTTDQRAAKEELLARITAQTQALEREREAISAEKAQLKRDQEQLALAKQQFESSRTTVSQEETELALKRKELETEQKQLQLDKSRITADTEKLVKDREQWVQEQKAAAEEKKALTIERDKLDAERKKLEQDRESFAAATGTTEPSTGVAQAKPVDEAARMKQLKTYLQAYEGRDAEAVAKEIKALHAKGEFDMVIDILQALDPRKSGSIIDALGDETVANDLLERLNKRDMAPKTATK